MSGDFNEEWGMYSLIGKSGGVSLAFNDAAVRIREGKDNLLTVSVRPPQGWQGKICVDCNGDRIIITEKGDPANRRRPRILVKMPPATPLQVVLSGRATLTTTAPLTGLEVVRAFDRARVQMLHQSAKKVEISGTDCARVFVSVSGAFQKLSAYAGGKSRITCEGSVRKQFKVCVAAKGAVAHAGKRPKRVKVDVESGAAQVHLAATAGELPEALRMSQKPARATSRSRRKDVTPA